MISMTIKFTFLKDTSSLSQSFIVSQSPHYPVAGEKSLQTGLITKRCQETYCLAFTACPWLCKNCLGTGHKFRSRCPTGKVMQERKHLKYSRSKWKGKPGRWRWRRKSEHIQSGDYKRVWSRELTWSQGKVSAPRGLEGVKVCPALLKVLKSFQLG